MVYGMHKEKWDVILVGAGPANIFAALELLQRSDLKILILEKGKDVKYRECPARKGLPCLRCNPCSVLSGWGGAGAFSDGKLTLTFKVGGWIEQRILHDKIRDPKKIKQVEKELIQYVDKLYLKFGAPNKVYGLEEGDEVEELKMKALKHGMRLIPMKVRHLGSENTRQVLANMKKYIERRAEILFQHKVTQLIVKGNKVIGVKALDKHNREKEFYADYIILGPGRVGASWLREIMSQLNVRTSKNPVDIGVRIEVPASVTESLTSKLYEFKLIYNTKMFDDVTRTFCVNPHGDVILECYEDIITVNGQSYLYRKTENTNFAILVNIRFTEPFEDPIAYGKYLARLANMISGGVIVQRLGDLLKGRRSTRDRIRRNPVEPTLKQAVPGDLSYVLPYRILHDVLEMLKALDNIAPGVYSPYTLLYGVEVKFYSIKVELDSEFRVRGVKGLYAIGDGAGITRGLMQASISGVLAARSILKERGFIQDVLSIE